MSTTGLKRRAFRVKSRQMDGLVEEVERDLTLDTGKFIGPRGKRKDTLQTKWERVASRLNNLGPAKSWPQWRQVWRDLRKRVRRHNAEVMRGLAAPGEQDIPSPLSDLEKKIVAIITHSSTVGAASVEFPTNHSTSGGADMEETEFPSIPTFDTFDPESGEGVGVRNVIAREVRYTTTASPSTIPSSIPNSIPFVPHDAPRRSPYLSSQAGRNHQRTTTGSEHSSTSNDDGNPLLMDGTNANLMAVASSLDRGLASLSEVIREAGVECARALNNLSDAIRSLNNN